VNFVPTKGLGKLPPPPTYIYKAPWVISTPHLLSCFNIHSSHSPSLSSLFGGEKSSTQLFSFLKHSYQNFFSVASFRLHFLICSCTYQPRCTVTYYCTSSRRENTHIEYIVEREERATLQPPQLWFESFCSFSALMRRQKPFKMKCTIS
jgi:hypothetical protein